VFTSAPMSVGSALPAAMAVPMMTMVAMVRHLAQGLALLGRKHHLQLGRCIGQHGQFTRAFCDPISAVFWRSRPHRGLAPVS
jgi:hypothetical protein